MNSINREHTKYFLITFDVEDWFQVENFKPWIPFETWDQRELRVEKNTHRLLDLLDSFESAGKQAGSEAGKRTSWQAKSTQKSGSMISKDSDNKPQTTDNEPTKKVQCTFFVLGWLAKKLPHLINEIQSRGHEIASHGCNHLLLNKLSPKELKKDLTNSKKQLEDIIGTPVVGYRAPSFAIDDDTLKIIEDAGYLYDSSYNSFGLHGRYGEINLNGTGKKGIAHKLSDNFYELPISNLRFSGLTFPLGGGGYFRLIPFPLFNLGIKSILKELDAYLFYTHPWEFDPGQPRMREASTNFKFRHYLNLSKTEARLKRLINKSKKCDFITCRDYIELLTVNN